MHRIIRLTTAICFLTLASPVGAEKDIETGISDLVLITIHHIVMAQTREELLGVQDSFCSNAPGLWEEAVDQKLFSTPFAQELLGLSYILECPLMGLSMDV